MRALARSWGLFLFYKHAGNTTTLHEVAEDLSDKATLSPSECPNRMRRLRLTRIIHERNRILDNRICGNDLATDPSLALCAGWHVPERSEGRATHESSGLKA